jgi:hypothetical protein
MLEFFVFEICSAKPAPSCANLSALALHKHMTSPSFIDASSCDMVVIWYLPQHSRANTIDSHRNRVQNRARK